MHADFEWAAEGQDGHDALKIACAGGTDVLVIDIAMPGKSGLEAVREIRALAPGLRILALSGYADEDYGKRMIALGADGYVHKGCEPHDLLAALRAVAAGQRHVPPVVAAQFAAEWIEKDTGLPARLTAREFEVMVKLASGQTLKAVAAAVDLSEKSVSLHRRALMDKLGVSSNGDLTYFALKHALLRFEHPFR